MPHDIIDNRNAKLGLVDLILDFFLTPRRQDAKGEGGTPATTHSTRIVPVSFPVLPFMLFVPFVVN